MRGTIKGFTYTGYRTYRHTNKGNVLLSWLQNKCRLCKKFLPKENTKGLYCGFCGNKVRHQVEIEVRHYVRETIQEIVELDLPRSIWRLFDNAL